MPRDNIVHIGRFDELTSVIDRVLTHQAETIFLVLDPEAQIAQNIFNLHLLKREAESVGKEIILVSTDARITALASKASFKVLDAIDFNESLSEAPLITNDSAIEIRTVGARTIRRRLMADILPPEQHTDDAPLELSKESLKIKRFIPEGLKSRSDDTLEEDLGGDTESLTHDFVSRNRRLKLKIPIGALGGVMHFFTSVFGFASSNIVRLFLALGGLGAVVVLIFVFSQILPRVTLSITPQRINDMITLQLVVDSNVSSADLERGIISGQILEERDEKDFVFEASGQVDINEYATGSITIFNEFSSSSQTLVASTRFLSADGQLFRTIETIVVPGATIEGGSIIGSSTSVRVRAAEPGAEYNIGSTTFSIPGFKGTEKYLAFYGKNEDVMSGGFQGVRAVVTQEDLEAAREKLETEFAPIVAGRLRNKIPDHLFVLEDSFSNEIEKIDFDVDGGDFEDSFTVHAIAYARIFLIDEKDITNAIEHYFRTSTEYSKEFELTESQQIDYTVREVDYNRGVASISLDVTQSFSRSIDSAQLSAEILGKNEIEVRQILSQKEELEKAQVRFWPFWVKSVPTDETRITIEIVVE